MPEPSAPSITVAPINENVIVAERSAINPIGADKTVEIETTRSISVAGE